MPLPVLVVFDLFVFSNVMVITGAVADIDPHFSGCR